MKFFLVFLETIGRDLVYLRLVDKESVGQRELEDQIQRRMIDVDIFWTRQDEMKSYKVVELVREPDSEILVIGEKMICPQ